MKKQLIIGNEISELQALTNFIESFCEHVGLPMTLSMNLNLVLEEAVSNIILYAFPNKEKTEIDITASYEKDKVIFTIVDQGIPFDPTQVAEANITLPAEERSIGGLGIFIIRKIMDSVDYERKDDKNKLFMHKSV